MSEIIVNKTATDLCAVRETFYMAEMKHLHKLRIFLCSLAKLTSDNTFEKEVTILTW